MLTRISTRIRIYRLAFFAVWFIIFGGFFGHACAQGDQRPQTDLRGPIRSEQFTVNRTADGIFATGLTYRPFPESAFTAHWIGMDPVRYPDQQLTRGPWYGKRKEGSAYMIKFKKLLRLDGDPVSANIRISADIKYRLFVNGVMVSRGPAAMACDYGDGMIPLQWYYDQFDSRHAFKKGLNSIAVEVRTTDGAGSSSTTGNAGLIMEAGLVLQSGKRVTVATDPSWVCDTSKSYLRDLAIDATRETDGWYTDTAYDPSWSHAVLIPETIAATWKLTESELPQMMETLVFPTQIRFYDTGGKTLSTQTASVFPIDLPASPVPQKIRLEFDRLYTGYLGMKLTGRSGTKLFLEAAETRGSSAGEIHYTMRDGVQTYESPALTDAKYVDVTITNPDAALTIDEIALDFSTFPVGYAGSFHCSDPMLNELWKNIRWIVQQNMQTYHMDSPIHQEPTCDAGDYMIESLINYYTFSSPLLVKQDLRKIASLLGKTKDRMFHTSYMLLWLQMLLHYYDYTGDKALLRELSPAVYGLLAQFHSYLGHEGIITRAPNYMFMDWGDLYGRSFHHPPASWGQAYMTAFYYKGLLEGSRLAGAIGQPAKSAEYTGEAARVKAAFAATLFTEKTGLFNNGIYGASTVKPYDWMPEDTAITYQLPYQNILAVLYGLAPRGDDQHVVRQAISQKEINMSPYFMYFVLEAIAQAGRFDDLGFAQMQRWKDISNNPVGLREGWAAGDFSHAWGGAPAYEMSSKVLGVVPSKPGFAEVTIAPHTGSLEYASGEVATPRGPVTVDWRRSDTAFTIKTSNPKGMPVVFFLPLYKNGEVIVNGKKVFSGNKVSGKETGKEIDIKTKVKSTDDFGKQLEISAPGGVYTIVIR
ncbi:MAG: alpha-L-rhamnosidase C-terminal domain-containing protein [Puia sp.]|nr:alpha-L-rhamnosidase C-terminal domain-containing protein [Puia sp.]